jgi:riboflavin synthase
MMFTGIVEGMGRVADLKEERAVRTLRIAPSPQLLDGLRPGSSVSVDGACLTVVGLDDEGFTVEVVSTTMARTVASTYEQGSRVNLERAAVLGDRIDGHILQGHVDGIGHLISVLDEGGSRRLEVTIPTEVHRLTVPRGSIGLNGVSLTVSELGSEDRIEVAVIPHTWEVTNFQYLSEGDPLNVEGDLIGKYVGKWLQRNEHGDAGGPARAI